ncbi:MAG: EexN family lipoprotein [Methylobacillus sp.]|nr:EexN family lipoprotein [Methylobacillus sp.]
MKKLIISLMIAVVLSGCDDFFVPTKTVDWYKTHETERKEILARCNNNPGELRDTPDCINAARAESEMALPAEKSPAISTSAQTVGWYKTHDTEREEMLARCDNNPGELGNTPDCINATHAKNDAAGDDELALARVIESVTYVSAAKVIVSEFYAANAAFPTNMASTGFDPGPTGYIRSVTWSASPDNNAVTGNLANIIITLAPDISPNNATYNLYFSVMSITNGMLIWKCNNGKAPRTDASSSGTLPNQYTPPICRTNG